MAFKMAGWSAFKQIVPDNEKKKEPKPEVPPTRKKNPVDKSIEGSVKEGKKSVKPPKMGPHNKIVGEQKKYMKVKGKIRRTPPGPIGRKI